MERNGARLQAAVRRRMDAGVREFFDSTDVLSTVMRLIDRYVAEGKADVATEGQLWALVNAVTSHQVMQKARAAQRLRRAVRGDMAQVGGEEPCVQTTSDEGLFDRAMDYLTDPHDRSVLLLRIGLDLDNACAAMVLGIGERPARDRWKRVRQSLRRWIEGNEPE